LRGAIADDTSSGVEFETLGESRRGWKSSKVLVDVVEGFNVEVLGEMATGVAASGTADGDLCGVTSSKGKLFDDLGVSRGGSGFSKSLAEVVTGSTSGELATLVAKRDTTPLGFGLNEVVGDFSGN